MFKYITEEKYNILSFPELKYVCKSLASVNSIKISYTAKKTLTKRATIFLSWYIKYCTNELKGKTFPPDKIAEQVFKTNIKTREFSEYFRKHLFISKEYCEVLLSKLKTSNITAYIHTLTNLIIDLEELICNYEHKVKKSIDEFSLTSGRRKSLSPGDIFYAAIAMFWIQDFKKVNDIYLRDFKPVAIFHMRQILEVYGKNLLGISEILDKNDTPSKKFTQVSWNLICEEVKQEKPRIKLPFNPHTISQVNAWANDFTHTTFLYSEYLQFFALNIISLLFKASKLPVKTYDNKNTTKFMVADTRIHNYNSLKFDIEKEMAKRQSGTKITWMEPNQVGAYIISL